MGVGPWRPGRWSGLVIATTVGIALWLGAAPARAADDVCATATALLTQGDLPAAEDAYREIASKHPDATCVASGRRTVAWRRCQEADQWLRAGQGDRAREAYAQILDAYRDTPCAVAGLRAIDGEGQVATEGGAADSPVGIVPMSAVTTTSGAGAGETASGGWGSGATSGTTWGSGSSGSTGSTGTTAPPSMGAPETTGLDLASPGATATGASGTGSSSPPPTGQPTETTPGGTGAAAAGGNTDTVDALRRLGRHEDAWSRAAELATTEPDAVIRYADDNSGWVVWNRIGTLWSVYLRPLVSIVCVALVIALGVFASLKFWRVRGRLKLDVDTFAPAAVQLKADPNEALVSRVEQMLTRLGEDDELYRPDMIDKAVDLPDPPADLDPLPPQVSQLWAFFNRLFPAKTVALSGVLQHSTRQGAGISLKLVFRRTGALWGSHTLWQSHVDPAFVPGQREPVAEDFLALAEPAAIWTYWKLVGRKKRLPDDESVPDLRRAFGTDNWRSYAGTIVGARLIEQGRLADAERMTRMALTFDRSNRHALFNLATLEVQSLTPGEVRADPSAYDDAVAHYDDVERLSGLAEQVGDRLHILSDYQRGAVEQYRHLLTGGQAGDLDLALRMLRRAEVHAVGAFGESDVVTKIVTVSRCAAEVLAEGPSEEVAGTIAGIERGYFAPRLLYTLSCYCCAEAAKQGADGGDADALLDRAWKHLRDALRTDPAYAGWARNDPSLELLRVRRGEGYVKLLDGI